MWTCKHCGYENENNLHECWNCGTGINWVPPTDAPESVSASPEDTTTSPNKAAPLSSEAASALTAVGIGIALIGIIAGIIVLVNAPDAPSDHAKDAQDRDSANDSHGLFRARLVANCRWSSDWSIAICRWRHWSGGCGVVEGITAITSR